MKLSYWENLPREMQTDAVRRYCDILAKKRGSLIFKRIFDLAASLILLAVLSPIFAILAVAIKLDSPGPVFYRQERVTQYGRRFKIHKFRTMVQNADKGSQVTLKGDSRVTRVGRLIRRLRLDEIAQLLDILSGAMTLVGTRPESPRYVEAYTDEMRATLLLPAGVTSLASIFYKDEAELLDSAADADSVYVERILPAKMYYNLKEIERFSFWREVKIMLMTALTVLGVDFAPEAPSPSDKDFAIRRIASSDSSTIAAVVDIHLRTFDGFFLTFLGRGFLKLLYRSYAEHENSGIFVAFDGGRPVGFLAYSGDLSGLYRRMIRKRLIQFAWCGLGAFVRRPTVFMRLVRALLKPSESKRSEAYVELASIGVEPSEKSRGIGTRLINALKAEVDFGRYAYIALETDALENDAANKFYRHSGFAVEREFETREGRKMLEYRYRGAP